MTDLATLELGTSTVVLRRAEVGDIPTIVDLLSADQLGVTRDGVHTAQDLAAHHRAFAPSTPTPPTSSWSVPKGLFTAGFLARLAYESMCWAGRCTGSSRRWPPTGSTWRRAPCAGR